MSIVNIAAYKFIYLSKLPYLREQLAARCRDLAIRGTILLSQEGINLMLAGEGDNIDRLIDCLRADQRFHDLQFKRSYSDCIPFARLKVRIKEEIVALKAGRFDIKKEKTPYVSATTLKSWLDESREVVLLDTRNQYEVSMGSFTNAIDLQLTSFREFPHACQQLAESYKSKPVVTFCTGGIRCEKAAPVLMQQGFKKVYQLAGGILQYFADCGQAYYQGNCFVFDERVAVDAQLAVVR